MDRDACYACLESDGLETPAGCACRKPVHVECLVRSATLAGAGARERWRVCSVCRSEFTGGVARALAERWVLLVRDVPWGEVQRTDAETNYARILLADGRYADARALARRVRESVRAASGAHVAALGEHGRVLALVAGELGRPGDAARALRRMVRVAAAVLGEGNVYTMELETDLARMMMRNGDDLEAGFANSDAVERRTRFLGAAHESLIDNRETDAILDYRIVQQNRDGVTIGRPRGPGLRALRAVLDERRRRFGEDHPSTARTASELGELMASAGGETADAALVAGGVAMMRAALATQRRTLGAAHPATARTEARLRACGA